MFTGRSSKFTTVHGLKGESDKDILGAFQDRIQWHGAPIELGSDNAVVYRSALFTKYLRDLYIRLWQSESYHQNQNYAENSWETLKSGTNRMIDFTAAPRNFAFLALMFYAFVLNHTVDSGIGDGTQSPYMLSTGKSDDISALLCFRFNEPVYCLVDTELAKFPSESKEVRAR
jgi:hypothetical protein